MQRRKGSDMEVMIQIPNEYTQSKNFKLWHAKTESEYSEISVFCIVNENGSKFLKFETDSFSQFVLMASKKVSSTESSVVKVTINNLHYKFDKIMTPDNKKAVSTILILVSILIAAFYLIAQYCKERSKMNTKSKI